MRKTALWCSQALRGGHSCARTPPQVVPRRRRDSRSSWRGSHQADAKDFGISRSPVQGPSSDHDGVLVRNGFRAVLDEQDRQIVILLSCGFRRPPRSWKRSDPPTTARPRLAPRNLGRWQAFHPRLACPRPDRADSRMGRRCRADGLRYRRWARCALLLSRAGRRDPANDSCRPSGRPIKSGGGISRAASGHPLRLAVPAR